jgi:cytochrome P450
MMFLGEYPDVQRRLQDEADEVLQGREPAVDDIARLKYHKQVLEETLR